MLSDQQRKELLGSNLQTQELKQLLNEQTIRFFQQHEETMFSVEDKLDFFNNSMADLLSSGAASLTTKASNKKPKSLAEVFMQTEAKRQ